MEYIEITSIEEALEKRNQLELELSKLNDQIFHETEESKTVEFNEHYKTVQDEFNYICEYLVKNKYKEQTVESGVINNASLALWFIMIPLIILTIYPLFNTIQLSILIKFLSIEKIVSLDYVKQIVVLICSFLILPVLLCVVALIVTNVIKKPESKKVSKILNLIFFISLAVSFVISFILNIVVSFIGK